MVKRSIPTQVRHFKNRVHVYSSGCLCIGYRMACFLEHKEWSKSTYPKRMRDNFLSGCILIAVRKLQVILFMNSLRVGVISCLIPHWVTKLVLALPPEFTEPFPDMKVKRQLRQWQIILRL